MGKEFSIDIDSYVFPVNFVNYRILQTGCKEIW